MRDLLLMSIVITVALAALWRPWIGVMLWTWVSLMNPHRYTYGFAYSAPIAALSAAATLVGWLFTREKQSPFKGLPVVFLALLTVWVTLSWQFGVDPMGQYQQWDKVIKIYFMVFITLSLLSNKYHIMAFVWVNVASLAILGAKGGIFTILTGGSYRVWGPPGSFIAGNNEFAVALIMLIPLLQFLKLQLETKWVQQIMNVVMLLLAASALGSHSRGALLAIAAMGMFFWWRSQKKLLLAIFLVIGITALVPMMPEHWFSRMHTIETYNEDKSSMERINSWVVGWKVGKSHFWGAGMSYLYRDFFDLYAPYDLPPFVAHSIYFQMLGNHGFIGLALFLLLWLTTYRTASWLRKNAKKIPEANWTGDLGAMVQVGLVGYAVGGAFLSINYFDLPYNMMIMVVLARKWVETRGWEHDPQISFLEYIGISNSKQQVTKQGSMKNHPRQFR